MRVILRQRGLRLVFTANLVSMLGSGMNSAAVIWYILQATHSEAALGKLLVIQTIPAMLMQPFAGVIIDREDRRRLVMLLDALRALVILTVSVLAFLHRVQLWHLYLMTTLVAAGFWMFWPTVTALIQELTPEDQFVGSNTLLLAGVQGGWLLAGAIVGFVYNHIGLGGVLLIDVSTYVVSFLCYLAVRKGRHVVHRPAAEVLHDAERKVEGAFATFFSEVHDGILYLRAHRNVVLLGLSWSFFVAAMLTVNVIAAPLIERTLHAGATGYGWLNSGWGVGAFTAALCAPSVIARIGSRRSLTIGLGLLALGLFAAPFSPMLAVVVAIFGFMGLARGIAGVALSSTLMEWVPKHFMGRVQNTFSVVAMLLEIVMAYCVGQAAHRVGLVVAFSMVAGLYALACVSSIAAGQAPQPAALAAEATD